MNMELTADITLPNLTFNVDEKALIIQLCKKIIGKNHYINNVNYEDGKLYVMYDASYHGSPDWQKQYICEDSLQAEKFILLRDILDIIKKQRNDESEYD